MTKIACQLHSSLILPLVSRKLVSLMLCSREHLQKWAVNTMAQQDLSSDQQGNSGVAAAFPATHVVLPVSLAELRQRYNAVAKLSEGSEGSQTLLEQVSILCGTWNM
jgi:hypothetical protein